MCVSYILRRLISVTLFCTMPICTLPIEEREFIRSIILAYGRVFKHSRHRRACDFTYISDTYTAIVPDATVVDVL